MSHANVHESNQTFTCGALAAPKKQHFSAILSGTKFIQAIKTGSTRSEFNVDV